MNFKGALPWQLRSVAGKIARNADALNLISANKFFSLKDDCAMATFDDDLLSQTTPPPASRNLPGGDRLARLAVAALTWESLAWFTLLVSAFLTRFWNLGARVVSHDESEHVYFAWLLSKGSGYNHNPMMHGPSLFELTAFFQTIFPVNDFTSRLAPALIGIAIVVLIPVLLRPWLGRWGALVTSLFLLISPYILYFSRYNRHDIYEIAWALLATYAILSYLRASGAAEKTAPAEGPPAPAQEAGEEPGDNTGAPAVLEAWDAPVTEAGAAPLIMNADAPPFRKALDPLAWLKANPRPGNAG